MWAGVIGDKGDEKKDDEGSEEEDEEDNEQDEEEKQMDLARTEALLLSSSGDDEEEEDEGQEAEEGGEASTGEWCDRCLFVVCAFIRTVLCRYLCCDAVSARRAQGAPPGARAAAAAAASRALAASAGLARAQGRGGRFVRLLVESWLRQPAAEEEPVVRWRVWSAGRLDGGDKQECDNGEDDARGLGEEDKMITVR